jgi:hypothetical protein
MEGRYSKNRRNKTEYKANLIGEKLGSRDKNFRHTFKKLIFYNL